MKNNTQIHTHGINPVQIGTRNKRKSEYVQYLSSSQNREWKMISNKYEVLNRKQNDRTLEFNEKHFV